MILTAITKRTASKQPSACAVSPLPALLGFVSSQKPTLETGLDPLMRGQYLSRSRLQTILINSFVEAIGQSRHERLREMVHIAIIVCDFSSTARGKN